MLVLLIFLLNSFILVLSQGADNRCFLENGGSAESFFVSEDSTVGSIIGTVRIIGDPSERGNIELRLKEVDSPIVISPGTSNLTLTRKLDKEGIEGPSSVYINIICDRKRTTVPGFVIPINIRVTDANDNAPQFVNAPYILNISEVTVVGTRVLQGVKAIDADQQGPYSTVQYSVLPGPNSDFFVFVNALEGTIVLRKPLDYETLSNFTIAIRAQDQGSPPQYTDTQLHVNVIDADDQNPKFVDDRYTTLIPDHAPQGTRLHILPREIAAYDQDLGINAPIYFSFNSANQDYRFFEMDRMTGHIIIKRSIPDDELLQPSTLVVKATQFDNPDRYALATLTVSRPGTSLRELQFLQTHYLAGVLENVPLNSVLLTVITNRHRDKRLRYWLDYPTDMFEVTSSGDIVLRHPLDYESQDNYVFQVHATDGSMNATANINISVLNVNDWDPRFRYPQYEFFVPDFPGNREIDGNNGDDSKGLIVGRVEAADGDRGDHITLSLRGPAARMFSIDDSGDIRINDLTALNSSTAHLVAVATDTGIPPRQASVPVIVHLPEAVVWRAGNGAWVGGASFIVVAVFGSILAVLALIIIILILYIHKHKRPKSSNRDSKTNGLITNTIEPEKLPPMSGTDNDIMTVGKIDNPVFGTTSTITQNHTNSPSGPPSRDSSYTATVKSIMARNNNSRNNQQSNNANRLHNTVAAHNPNKHKVAPAPPQVPIVAQHSDSSRTPTPETQNNIVQSKGGISWPMGSIPRRVKKLSWDDEGENSNFHQNKTEMDPDVSVTPLGPDFKTASDQMNLTVYF
ncbi:protocadherin Fat 4-like Cad96Ca [Lycorma delicatula]|uniref:protocadherin Fat 4-like Cad96Ca n=1 Tax=Lycorma delicatula TaxID=130591 RepID=UPI003F50D61E